MSYLTQILLKNGLGYPGTVLETAEPAYDSSGNLFYIGNGIGNVPTVFYPDVSVGVQGVQGVQGTQGILGAQGAQGTDGAQGLQGIQGITGIQGTDGAQGVQGTQGTNGTQGAQGLQGVQGTDGIQGAQGVQGWGDQTYIDGSLKAKVDKVVIAGDPSYYTSIYQPGDEWMVQVFGPQYETLMDTAVDYVDLAITGPSQSPWYTGIRLGADTSIVITGNMRYAADVSDQFVDLSLVDKAYVDTLIAGIKPEVDQYEFATANYLLPTPSGSGIRFILKNLYTNDISVYCDSGYYVDYRSSKVLLSMNTIDLYDYDVSNWFIV